MCMWACVFIHSPQTRASKDVFLSRSFMHAAICSKWNSHDKEKETSEILHETVNEAEKERERRVGVENEAEIDRAQVSVLIQCVCGPLRELSLLANKEAVDENKAEVA